MVNEYRNTQKQLAREYDKQQKQSMYRTNTPRQAKIKGKMYSNVSKIEDAYLKQSRQNDSFFVRAMEVEQRAGRPVSRTQQLSATGFFDKYKKGTTYKSMAKDISRGIPTGEGVRGKFQAFKEQGELKSAGRKASRLNPKYQAILSQQKSGKPSMNPLDVAYYTKQKAKGLKTKVQDVVQKRNPYFEKVNYGPGDTPIYKSYNKPNNLR